MPIQVPNWANADDRGTEFYDLCTGSTRTKPVAYDRDLKGCGEPEYVFFRSGETVNQRADCVTKAVFGLSISGFVYYDTNAGDVFDAEMDALQAILKTAIETEGGTISPVPDPLPIQVVGN